MTLDEAIAHAREKANGDGECAREHRQLADWLEQLKSAREGMFAQIPQMAKTVHENHELEAENAELRELCKDLRTWVTLVPPLVMDDIDGRMTKLGIDWY